MTLSNRHVTAATYFLQFTILFAELLIVHSSLLYNMLQHRCKRCLFILILALVYLLTLYYYKDWYKPIGKGDLIESTNFKPTSHLKNNTSPEEPRTTIKSHLHVLASSYYGQQTAASLGLTHLQCWARSYNANVVEPFTRTRKSHLYNPFPRNTYNADVDLKFGDMIDLESWNRLSREMNYTQLVSWESFLNNAPRKVIVVYMNFGKKQKNETNTLPQNTTDCLYSSVDLSHDYIEKWKFEIVQEVCLNFMNHGDTLSMDAFANAIFGTYIPSSVTVVFYTWRLLHSVTFDAYSCDHKVHIEHFAPPSSAARQDAQDYIRKYLNQNKYIALMVRMEKTIVHLLHKDSNIIEKCYDIIPEYVDRLKNMSGISMVFLAIDFGKFGSASMRQYEKKMAPNFKHFFHRLFGNSNSISQWEESFTETARYKSNGYTALVQMWVAVKAEHIIISGGGSFQNHVTELFMNENKLHSKNNTVRVVRECTAGPGSEIKKIL